MKSQTFLFLGAATAALLSPISAQTVINITGATAFRAAAHNGIVSALGGSANVSYAYLGSTLEGANQAYFSGTINGQPYVVRTRFSGSTQGVLDLAQGNNISGYLTSANPRSTGSGTRLKGAADSGDFPVALTESAVPIYAFSDVDKALSTVPNANLGGGPVGIVPFAFVAGRGAPSYIDNVTDQIHETLWSTGQMRASFFSGNSADDGLTILATGRNLGSGTRASILSETGYGSNRAVLQFNVDVRTQVLNNAQPPVLVTNPDRGAVTEFGNGGHSSNSFVSGALNFPRADLKFGGQPIDAAFVSYLTISDAIAVSGYDELTGLNGNSVDTSRPRVITYNGERYSAQNVSEGIYTLWGYQQLYSIPTLTPAQQTFNTAVRAGITATLTPSQGLKDDASVRVTRLGGDGGPIFPK